MKSNLYLALLSLVAFTTLSSYDKIAQLPTGRCGVPNEMTCYDGCHTSGRKFNAPNITIDFGGGISKFEYDSTYLVNLNFAAKTNKRYGFQGAIKDGALNDIGTFTTNSTTSIKGGNICYSVVNATGSFSFYWKAPSKSSLVDSMVIYLAYVEGNKANGNLGDSVFLKTLTIPASKTNIGPPSSISEVGEAFYVYPTIASSHLNLSQESSWKIYDLHGKMNLSSDVESSQVSIQSLVPGIYYLQVPGQVIKFIKE